MSLTSVAPAAAPSVLNSSRPWTPSSAKKNRAPLTSVSWTGLAGRVAVLTSATRVAERTVRSSRASRVGRRRGRLALAGRAGAAPHRRRKREDSGKVRTPTREEPEARERAGRGWRAPLPPDDKGGL